MTGTTLGRARALWFFAAVVAGLAWYWLVPVYLPLEFIEEQDTGMEWSELWEQIADDSHPGFSKDDSPRYYIRRPDIDFRTHYLVVSANRPLKSVTYTRISRYLWPYREVYDGKAVFYGEPAPTKRYLYRTPHIRCDNIDH